MCKAPKPPKPKEPKKPMFLKNRYLDEFVGDAQAVKSLKQGRSSLRIAPGSDAPTGRQPGETLTQPTGSRRPPTSVPGVADAQRVRGIRGRIVDTLLQRR